MLPASYGIAEARRLLEVYQANLTARRSYAPRPYPGRIGHFRHTEIRAEAELASGPHFHRRDYHDFILRQGLIPPALLHRQVGEYLAAARPGLAA
ncbi:MAG: DUF885 domain-containing protein [bacterium]|nr:DUF885 domain-containing protein [bacterium]